MDKHIRRLDSDLARFETEIHDKAASNSRVQEETSSTKSMPSGFDLNMPLNFYPILSKLSHLIFTSFRREEEA